MAESKNQGSQNKNQQGNNRNKNNNGGQRRNNPNQGNRNQGNKNQGNRNQGKQNNHNKNRQAQKKSGQQRSNRKPAPKPLTFWQKILALFGIKPKQQQSRTQPKQQQPQQKKKTSQPPAAKKAQQPKKVEVTNSRLYVGNLSYETTEYDLEELFKGNGPVKKVEIIYNRHTHKSKGYGFIEMLNIDDAKNAVEVHNDQPFMGRNLIVNGAKNRQHQQEDKEKNHNAA